MKAHQVTYATINLSIWLNEKIGLYLKDIVELGIAQRLF